MPLVRISLVKGKPEAYRRKVGDAVHRALVETIGVPPLDRFQLLTEHEPLYRRIAANLGAAVGLRPQDACLRPGSQTVNPEVMHA